MGNLPAGDFAHLTYITDLHRAGQVNFTYFDASHWAASFISKEAGHAR